MYLLYPGRHHMLTTFQLQYLTRATAGDLASLPALDGRPLGVQGPIDTIVWAVTSANHASTRRNPLPAFRRAAAIEEFATQLDVPSLVFLIDDIPTSAHFAEYILKLIEVESRGDCRMTPANTVVATSTPEVYEQFERLGFPILPVELADRGLGTYQAATSWHILQALFGGAHPEGWRTDDRFLTQVARASRRTFLRYGYGDQIIEAARDALLSDDGDLTETRDYNVYVRAFDEGADRKYDLVHDHVRPGRVADVGCCTGAFLACLARDARFADSDLYGVEVARRLYAECLHRKEQGYFAIPTVFFYHGNAAARTVFPPGFIDTFTTFSLTHELESYQGRAALERFLGLLHEQLAPGGRWINVDVVGPENGSQTVLMALDPSDGLGPGPVQDSGTQDRKALRDQLAGLSTFGRFLRFQADFRRKQGYTLRYEIVRISGRDLVRLSLRDACEFLSKKDYLDNWRSEMNETFCYWALSDWRRAVEAAGFRVHPDSRTFANPWIIENRYRGKAELFREDGGRLVPLDYPVTTMVLIADRA